jgi:hypothetical protein
VKGGLGGGWATVGVARPPQRRSGARGCPPPCRAEGRASRPSGESFSGIGTWLAQALAGKLDSVGVVNDAVEDGVGERGNADQVVPAVDGNLTGDDERSLSLRSSTISSRSRAWLDVRSLVPNHRV